MMHSVPRGLKRCCFIIGNKKCTHPSRWGQYACGATPIEQSANQPDRSTQTCNGGEPLRTTQPQPSSTPIGGPCCRLTAPGFHHPRLALADQNQRPSPHRFNLLYTFCRHKASIFCDFLPMLSQQPHRLCWERFKHRLLQHDHRLYAHGCTSINRPFFVYLTQ